MSTSFEYGGLMFEWDENKNQSNIRKHGISFEEAAEVFSDVNAVIIPDSEHSYNEERFTIIGFSEEDKLLTVCHCKRQSGEITRIISARKVTRIERNLYGGY